jgi:hypothetical protein
MNGSLQRRVADLEAANTELELFSSAVAHALRGPLRRVSGFIDKLMPTTEQLSGEARTDYGRIHANITRAQTMVDALFDLAHTTRKPLLRQPVDMVALAREAFADVQTEYADRHVSLQLDALPSCLGDPVLVRYVWGQLLANALKFTAQRETAHIHIRSEMHQVPIYLVQDNGIGFDMRYHDRLFLPFNRLHSHASYAGTGIGLATVQRIVRRHGGRIWAESAMGEGATFGFTLSPPA